MQTYMMNHANKQPAHREMQAYQYEVFAFKAAHMLYQKVERRAKWRRFFSRLVCRCCTLPSLTETGLASAALNGYSQSTQAVELSRICGSESRSQDFDRSFYPLTPRNRERWIHIAELCLGGKGLPAVDLIQVGDSYYVRDGHHRISVMRALGYCFVDARVMVWQKSGRACECPAAG